MSLFHLKRLVGIQESLFFLDDVLKYATDFVAMFSVF
jgi:hypothetical protein